MPASRYRGDWKLSRKNPRSSWKQLGSISRSPLRSVCLTRMENTALRAHMNTKYGIQTRTLEVDLIEQHLPLQIIFGDPGRGNRVPIDITETATDPVEIVPQRGISDPRKADPGERFVRKNAAAPAQWGFLLAYCIQVKCLHCARPKVKAQYQSVNCRKIEHIPCHMAIVDTLASELEGTPIGSI